MQTPAPAAIPPKTHEAEMIRRSPGHHLGGPHPRRLSLEAGAPVKYPNGRRVEGRTLMQAIRSNNFKEHEGYGIQEATIPTRDARRAPLVAPPRRPGK